MAQGCQSHVPTLGFHTVDLTLYECEKVVHLALFFVPFLLCPLRLVLLYLLPLNRHRLGTHNEATCMTKKEMQTRLFSIILQVEPFHGFNSHVCEFKRLSFSRAFVCTRIVWTINRTLRFFDKVIFR